MYVADVIRALTNGGVPLQDLFITAREGEIELRDETGSYGVRRFADVSVGVGERNRSPR